MTACVISRAEIDRRIAAGRKLGSAQKRYLRCLERGDPDECAYCGTELTDANRTIDHRISVLRGGTNDLDNLCLACKSCNSRKGAMTVAEFLPLIAQPAQPATKQVEPAHSLGVRGRKRAAVPVMSLMGAESRFALLALTPNNCTNCHFARVRAGPLALCTEHGAEF